MAYEFTKLSEVPVIDTVTSACNILVEDGGEVKRTAQSNISAAQVQANWAEDDESSPAFIMNKPMSLGGGVTWFTVNGSSVTEGNSLGGGVSVTASDVLTAFNTGPVRVNYSYYTCCSSYSGIGTVVSYSTSSYTPCGCGSAPVTTYVFYYATSNVGTPSFSLT